MLDQWSIIGINLDFFDCKNCVYITVALRVLHVEHEQYAIQKNTSSSFGGVCVVQSFSFLSVCKLMWSQYYVFFTTNNFCRHLLVIFPFFSTYHFCVLMFKTMIIQPKFTFVIMEPFKAYHAVFVLQIVECRMMTYSFQPLLKKK